MEARQDDSPVSASAFEAPWSPSTARMGPAMSTRVKNSSLHGTRASERNDARLSVNMAVALSGKKSRDDIRARKELDSFSSIPSPPARANTTRQRQSNKQWEKSDEPVRILHSKTSDRSLRRRQDVEDRVPAMTGPTNNNPAYMRTNKRRSEAPQASPRLDRDEPATMRPSTSDGKKSGMVTQGTQTSVGSLADVANQDRGQRTHTRISGRSTERHNRRSISNQEPSTFHHSTPASSRNQYNRRSISDRQNLSSSDYSYGNNNRNSNSNDNDHRHSRSQYRRDRSPSPPPSDNHRNKHLNVPRNGRPHPILSLAMQSIDDSMPEDNSADADQFPSPLFKYGKKTPKTNSIEAARRDINQMMESVVSNNYSLRVTRNLADSL